MKATVAPISIATSRYGAIGAALGSVLSWCQRLRGRERYDALRMEFVGGVPIVVMPTVFNPRLLRTGMHFAALLNKTLIQPQMHVLDMGTGSGICAVFAAKHARRVVAVDLNPAAVRCAKINALLNDVDAKVDARHGDLFEPLGDERFDLVLFNPPFIRAAPKDQRDYAWRSLDANQRFAATLRRHLNPGGYALVLLSTFGDAPSFVDDFYRHNYRVTRFAQHDFVNETLTILKVEPNDHNGNQ